MKNGLTGVKTIAGGEFIDTLVFNNDTIKSLRKGTISDWTVDYVLPLSQSKNQRIQYFPPGVLDDVVRAYLWVLNKTKKNDIISINIPIKLNYKDINEKWYRKKLEMTVNCGKNGNMVSCSIDVELTLEDYMSEFKK